MAFVATSAPSGWKCGRWSQVDQKTWQEEKTDNAKIVYTYQLVNGPNSFNGSNTTRLKMKDQNTEVLLLDSSAQVFVNGSYLGEYGGSWESGGSKRPVAQRAPAAGPAQSAQSQRSQPPSKQGAAFEQTSLPAPAQTQKSAPPAQQKAAPPPPEPRKASREPAAASPAPAAATRQPLTLSPPPDVESRPRKPEGLDNSAPSMQKLCDAAKNGEVAKVKELLESGIDPDGPAKDGNTPLMCAARGGHLAVVEALLQAYADPTLGKGDETPMTIAFQKGKQDMLKVLFQASFGHLETMVKPACWKEVPDAGIRSDNQDVPENAEQELRDVTTILAHVAGRDRPESPENHKKYGNYAQLRGNTADDAEKDSDMMREQSVRLAMKSLVKTANAEITGLDSFA